MHLWPSKMLRDSFKDEYLRRVERNLRMMKREKKKKQQQESTSNEQALLDREEQETPSSKSVCGFLRVFGHSVMVIACTYCCFCCAGEVSIFLLLCRSRLQRSWVLVDGGD